jgi:hypothetical protein
VAGPLSLPPLPFAASSPVNSFLATFLLGDGGGDNLFFVVLFRIFVEELPGASTAALKVLSCVKIYQN